LYICHMVKHIGNTLYHLLLLGTHTPYCCQVSMQHFMFYLSCFYLLQWFHNSVLLNCAHVLIILAACRIMNAFNTSYLQDYQYFQLTAELMYRLSGNNNWRDAKSNFRSSDSPSPASGQRRNDSPASGGHRKRPRIIYDANEVKQWLEARKKNYPTSVNINKVNVCL
jgi:hypothetical protein